VCNMERRRSLKVWQGICLDWAYEGKSLRSKA
jgi:hypothetical protein